MTDSHQLHLLPSSTDRHSYHDKQQNQNGHWRSSVAIICIHKHQILSQEIQNNLILIFGRFDRLTSLTGLTKYSLLAPSHLPSPVSPAEHSAPLERRVNGDGVLIQRSSPLQLQHASQQSEATYDPISITPAAGHRATWCDPATCGLCRHKYALGMLALTHRLSLTSRCLHTRYM